MKKINIFYRKKYNKIRIKLKKLLTIKDVDIKKEIKKIIDSGSEKDAIKREDITLEQFYKTKLGLESDVNSLKNPKSLSERLRNYIYYLGENTKFYEAKRKIFLEIIISIFLATITILIVGFRLFYDINRELFIHFSDYLLIFSILLIILLILSGLIIFYYFIENPTKFEGEMSTLWHYNGNIENEELPANLKDVKSFITQKIKKMDDEKFILDDLKSLYKLYCYQQNYYKLAKQFRIFGLIVSTYLIVILIILLIAYFIFF